MHSEHLILKTYHQLPIYMGHRANGVVLITTKKGSAGISEISVKATYGISKLANLFQCWVRKTMTRAYM